MSETDSPRIAELPLLDHADVVITEGTVAGLSVALDLAEAGISVILLSRGTSLPHEIVNTMRAWLPGDPDFRKWGRLGALLEPSLENGRPHLSRLTEAVEDRLIEAGVRFYYDAHPAGALLSENRVAGVAFGGKSGLCGVTGGAVVDCSPGAVYGRSAGAKFELRSHRDSTEVAYVLHHDADGTLISPPACDSWHIAVHGPYLELRTTLPLRTDRELGYARACREVRRKLLEDAENILNPVLQALPVDRGADDLTCAPRLRLQSSLSEASLSLRPEALVADGHPNLLVLSPEADLTSGLANEFTWDWTRLLAETQEILPAIRDTLRPFGGTDRPGGALRLGHAASSSPTPIPAGSIHVSDPGYRERGSEYRPVSIPALPILDRSGIFVAGAGTSGMPAAMTAGERGADTVCTEKHGDPGGVNTTGGVGYYWFGRWSRCFKKHLRRLRDFSRKSQLPPAHGQLKLMLEEGVRFYPRTPLCGVIRDERIIRAVVVPGAEGLGLITADTFVDATGDGDLAAWAGNPYTYGSERDEITMWSSFGKFHSGKREASRHYLTVADQRSPSDIVRAVIAGRRQVGISGPAEYPQFYMAVRESRHIRGRRRVTYLDVLTDKQFTDTALVCRANFDIKGMQSSDAVFCGFVEEKVLGNFHCRLPFSAALPEALDNLVIAGKAFSISHDGLALARMQPDMIGMGAAMALAAVEATKKGTILPELSIDDLQRLWVEAGIVEAFELAHRPEHSESGLSEEDLELLCWRVATAAVELDDEGRVLAAGDRAIPHLKAALPEAFGPYRVIVARMLACLGDPSGNDILLERLDELLSGGTLPSFDYGRHIMPDHGRMAETIPLLNALALSGDRRVLRILAVILDRLVLDPETSDWRFGYVHSLAYVSERLADPESIPLLRRLLTDNAFQGVRVSRNDDPRRCTDPVRERFAYLELSLGRALARCGHRRGWEILIDYLDDARSFLFRSALHELRELSGRDFEYDTGAWKKWLATSSEPTEPRPLLRRFD